MTPFTLDISETIACYHCKATVLAGEQVSCPACGTESHAIPFGDFFAMLERGEVIQARAGGLVIGRTCEEDDIPMFRYAGGGHFQLLGLMQGGEFLMAAEATARHYDRLREINSEIGEWLPATNIPLSAATTVINTNHVNPSAYLWIQTGQFVINRHATAKHLVELEQLNAQQGY